MVLGEKNICTQINLYDVEVYWQSKNGISLDKCHLLWHIIVMKTVTQIDSAGRLVIPKELRKQFGLESGQRVRLIPGSEGVTIVPEHHQRRFIKRGPILTIDTGAGTAPIDVFDISPLRENHLKEKAHENRRR